MARIWAIRGTIRRRRVNGVINSAFLAAIRDCRESLLASRWIGRDFPTIAQKSRATVRHLRGPPIRNIIAAKDFANLTILGPIQRCCVNGSIDIVSLAPIRVWKERILESRRMGRISVRIPRRSWAPHPPFLWAPIQPIIAAKDGPNSTNLGPTQRWFVNGVRNRISLAAIRVRAGVVW